MKTAVIYASVHHKNTERLVNAIVDRFPEVEAFSCTECRNIDLGKYDRIGFASGIAFGKFYPQITRIMQEKLPVGKKVFLIYTSGSKSKKYGQEAEKIANSKNSEVLGIFDCRGFDTYGIFKFIGGISKGHPTEKDILNAIDFYSSL